MNSALNSSVEDSQRINDRDEAMNRKLIDNMDYNKLISSNNDEELEESEFSDAP